MDKVKSDFLIFPQSNQMVLTKLNKLFDINEFEKVEKIQKKANSQNKPLKSILKKNTTR